MKNQRKVGRMLWVVGCTVRSGSSQILQKSNSSLWSTTRHLSKLSARRPKWHTCPMCVYQDNMSTIKHIDKGSDSELTRHISISYFWADDMIAHLVPLSIVPSCLDKYLLLFPLTYISVISYFRYPVFTVFLRFTFFTWKFPNPEPHPGMIEFIQLQTSQWSVASY